MLHTHKKRQHATNEFRFFFLLVCQALIKVSGMVKLEIFVFGFNHDLGRSVEKRSNKLCNRRSSFMGKFNDHKAFGNLF